MLAAFLDKIVSWWAAQTTTDIVWLTVGMLGQVMFTARWLLQWIASEKARRSIVPELFWYFSLVGSLMVLCYGVYKIEPVIIAGQFGAFIYARNIYFLWIHKEVPAPVEDAAQSQTG